METPRTFTLVGGPFDGRANEMSLEHPPEQLVIAVPTDPPPAVGKLETRVAIYRREQVDDGTGGQTYQYRYRETRGLHPGETLR